MGVLSVAICTKKGKLLLCRNEEDISRTLVEDCVKSLSSLIKEDQQHTYVEHNNFRLNYLPMDTLYILTISTKRSNILEDIEIVRTLQNVVTQVLASSISEATICEQAIDLILAIDDVISLGYRNICSESMVISALQMDSANEKMHVLMEANQKANAKIEMNNYIKNKKKGKLEEGYGGAGSESLNLPKMEATTGGGNDSKEDIFPSSYGNNYEDDDLESNKKSTIRGKKVMTLGKKKEKAKQDKKKQNLELKKELKNDQHTPSFNPLDAGVTFTLSERVSCELDKEGKASSFLVKGELAFVINNPDKKRIAVKVDKSKATDVKLKVPPSFDKNAWAEAGVLVPKNDKLSLVTGSKIPAIKYSISKIKGSFSPINLTIWLSEGSLTLEVEFNQQQTWIKELKNLKIKFITGDSEPEVESKENSAFAYDDSEEKCVWSIPLLSSAVSDANIELSLSEEVSEDVIFPMIISFDLKQPFIPLTIEGCKCLDTEEDVKFEQKFDLQTENFTVTN